MKREIIVRDKKTGQLLEIMDIDYGFIKGVSTIILDINLSDLSFSSFKEGDDVFLKGKTCKNCMFLRFVDDKTVYCNRDFPFGSKTEKGSWCGQGKWKINGKIEGWIDE